MNFPSIRIEGAIFSPDILERIEDAPGQRPSDFGLDSSVKVKDEIARAWADAQDYWRIFQRKLETVKPGSPATTETRQQWIGPLMGLLGYQLEYQPRGRELNGKTYPISHRSVNQANTPVHIIGYHEPAGLDRKPEKMALRMSAHAMVQEYLNLQDELYGLVTNGRLLRLLRDSSRLVKLTYLEFDLDRIFTDGLFADFALMFRLLHATRMPASSETAAESIIERYHQDSLESGERIRDGLSRAVEEAILAFANGFLTHRTNNALREDIASGKLPASEYYQHLLRLIYRLLFLMVIEERGLVFPPGADSTKRAIYEKYYSLQRLRRLSERRYLADHRRHDLWLSLLATFRLFEANGPGDKLGLAPLAGDLFNPRAIGPLGDCMLGNDVLLGCLRSLSLYSNPITRQVIRVNYGALNVEEFGSVYEGLLEYEPAFLSVEDRVEFAFAQGDERANTGSHYTPDDLVQPLIKHSLDYLIADKLKEKDPEKALLSLRVADISCGSGHILLAAARRIATQLASVRTGEEQPSPVAFRMAVRDVIRECIYGVDINPLAVELCKVALWLEAHNPGAPLNFLDHHIRCGNAVVGFARREEVERGVPDDAFKTMPGDDKEVAAEFRRTNKAERKDREKRQARLVLSVDTQKHLETVLARWREVSALPERNPDEIEAKKKRYLEFTQSRDAWLPNQIAAIPIAQFYIDKTQENQTKLITDADFWRYWTGERHPQGEATGAAWAMANNKDFFHWFLEFPDIIENGGYDCILGNPPFLGGQKLSGTFGNAFLNWVKSHYVITGSCDLVTYFFRRAFNLLRPGGYMGLISTNSISQGVAREGGLEVILQKNGAIVFAVASQRWPGRAAVEVSLIGIHKGRWAKPAMLNGKSVPFVSSFLDADSDDASPKRLFCNEDLSFMGSTVVGPGFVLSENEARALLKTSGYEEVVLPYLNGRDLNTHPQQLASRHIINLGEMPLRKLDRNEWAALSEREKLDLVKVGIVGPDYCEPVAEDYPQILKVLEERVKPYRERENYSDKSVRKWWQFYRPATNLYTTVRNLDRVLVTAQVSKTTAFEFVRTRQVFDAKLIVFAFRDSATFSVMQSNFHVCWAWKYCTTMKTDLSYGPDRIFMTFPFPRNPRESNCLASVGERYREQRCDLMRLAWLGLTGIYNLLHDPTVSSNRLPGRKTKSKTLANLEKHLARKAEECTVDDVIARVVELRRLHVELDTAVRDAYGWQDLDLGHDFHEVETLPENDRIRYTISPETRREVLKRLLALNHQRAAEEAAEGPVKAKARVAKRAAEPIEVQPGTPCQADLELPTEAIAASATPSQEMVGKGKVVLDVLALLYEAPGNRLDRLTLEEALILMRHDNLRQRIASQGVVARVLAARPNRPRITHMDDFLAEFNNSQFALSTKHLTQTIALGPGATPLTNLRNQSVGQEALRKAKEALSAIDRIRATCATPEEQLDALGAEDVTAFAIREYSAIA